MKRIITSLLMAVVLAASFTTAQVVHAQDFDKGLAAYNAKDFATALREWRPLAAQGNADAQFFLGLMYGNGLGVTQDYKEAARLYGLAAAQGNADAQFFLGEMYYNGLGVTQDYKEAARLYGLAAAQDYAFAQGNLGLMYDKGRGVTQDYVRAHMWFNLEAVSGDSKNASANRDRVAAKMTPAQIAEAQKLARECVKKNYKGC